MLLNVVAATQLKKQASTTMSVASTRDIADTIVAQTLMMPCVGAVCCITDVSRTAGCIALPSINCAAITSITTNLECMMLRSYHFSHRAPSNMLCSHRRPVPQCPPPKAQSSVAQEANHGLHNKKCVTSVSFACGCRSRAAVRPAATRCWLPLLPSHALWYIRQLQHAPQHRSTPAAYVGTSGSAATYAARSASCAKPSTLSSSCGRPT
jgi:hypothetical protein